jgi:hypothetical protein
VCARGPVSARFFRHGDFGVFYFLRKRISLAQKIACVDADFIFKHRCSVIGAENE